MSTCPLATPLHLTVGGTAVIGSWGYGTQSGGGPQRFGNAESSTMVPWTLQTDDLFVPVGSFLGPENNPGAFPTLLDGPSPNKYAAGTFMFADDALTSAPAVFGSARHLQVGLPRFPCGTAVFRERLYPVHIFAR